MQSSQIFPEAVSNLREEQVGHVCVLFVLAITVKLQRLFGFRLRHLQGYLLKIFHEKSG